MLLGVGRRTGEITSDVDSVHNYYEHLVFDELTQNHERCQVDSDFLADAACVALNHLPPKYIRHNVDMTFFMSTQELDDIHSRVREAVKKAVTYVTESEIARRKAQDNEED